MSELSIMSHLEPVESGETQICSEGIRVSSYETVDGVPFTSQLGLQQSLEYKRAFDESWAGINEPELKDEPETPIIPVPVVVAVAVQTKQPESALEDHTAGLSTPDEEWNRLDDLAAYVAARSHQEATPCTAQENAENGHSDSQNDDLVDSEVLEAFADSSGCRDNCQEASETPTKRAEFDAGIEDSLTDGYLGVLEPDADSRDMALETIQQDSTDIKPIRRHDPWKAYAKPASNNVTRRNDSAQTQEPRPPRARDTRKTPLRKHAGVPDYVKSAKIAEQDDKCIYCDRLFGSPILHYGEVELLEPEPEHFRPQAASGRTSDSNIDMACHVCNACKSDFIFDSRSEVIAFLVKERVRRGYTDCPLLISFQMQAIASYN